MTKTPKPLKVKRIVKKPVWASATNIYESPTQISMFAYVPKSCTESLNTVCSMCPDLVVEDTTHLGADCTMSRCRNKHWVGTRSWNWLFNEEKPLTKLFVKRKHV